MHDMAGEEKNKREVLLLAARKRLGGTQQMLPGFLFTRSEEAYTPPAMHSSNHKTNPIRCLEILVAGVMMITSSTAL
jgi:hypothetical protein